MVSGGSYVQVVSRSRCVVVPFMPRLCPGYVAPSPTRLLIAQRAEAQRPLARVVQPTSQCTRSLCHRVASPVPCPSPSPCSLRSRFTLRCLLCRSVARVGALCLARVLPPPDPASHIVASRRRRASRYSRIFMTGKPLGVNRVIGKRVTLSAFRYGCAPEPSIVGLCAAPRCC